MSDEPQRDARPAKRRTDTLIDDEPAKSHRAPNLTIERTSKHYKKVKVVSAVLMLIGGFGFLVGPQFVENM